MTVASVHLWGAEVGTVSVTAGEGVASFEFDPAFAESGVELSPLHMPAAGGRVYRFPELVETSFGGLPGLIADSLPDRFSNVLIDAWLTAQGRAPDGFDAVDRLRYVGGRGMGALEF